MHKKSVYRIHLFFLLYPDHRFGSLERLDRPRNWSLEQNRLLFSNYGVICHSRSNASADYPWIISANLCSALLMHHIWPLMSEKRERDLLGHFRKSACHFADFIAVCHCLHRRLRELFENCRGKEGKREREREREKLRKTTWTKCCDKPSFSPLD